MAEHEPNKETDIHAAELQLLQKGSRTAKKDKRTMKEA